MDSKPIQFVHESQHDLLRAVAAQRTVISDIISMLSVNIEMAAPTAPMDEGKGVERERPITVFSELLSCSKAQYQNLDENTQLLRDLLWALGGASGDEPDNSANIPSRLSSIGGRSHQTKEG